MAFVHCDSSREDDDTSRHACVDSRRDSFLALLATRCPHISKCSPHSRNARGILCEEIYRL
jgi:hypothetical protein